MNKREKILLLDMDGTITPARERIKSDMIFCLIGACRRTQVSIVSGSDYDYVYEQCGKDFLSYGIATSITLMPCNGTKVYKYNQETKDYSLAYSKSMKDKLGPEYFRELIAGIIKAQSAVLERYDISISENFIADRSSTVNWCPIGRACSAKQRTAYTKRPDRDSLRTEGIRILKAILQPAITKQLEFALGGQTSIDIYPLGWDKTFALNHYTDHESWFIGDKCEEGENDVHLYKLLAPSKRGFKTSGPQNTIEIIDSIIDDIVAEAYERG